LLQKTGLYATIGEGHFFEHTGEAINYALNEINQNKCLGCKHFAFRECDKLSEAKRDGVEKRPAFSS
jgi:sulfate permease, SulP family